MSKGRRRFQFGGDAALWSEWSAHLPTFIDGKFGTIELFLLPGGTPMLCGRPIIEALGITMDFARKRLRFGASQWVEATLGRQGEYLWSLTSEHDNMDYDVNKPDFELRTADPDVKHVDGYHLTDFLDAEHGFTAREELGKREDKPEIRTLKQELKTMDVHLRTHLNNLSAFVTKELHRPERPRVLWEVYCGTARTSQVAESMGMEVRRFSYETGWDFDRLDYQQQFLVLLEEEQPDEVLITPECKLWSRMQSLGRRTWHQQEALIAARERHHDRHLMFTKKVYLTQINGGRHATVEQPKHALSWRTRALRDLPGRRADFSQCRYGAQCLDTDGIWRPVRKDTTLLTSKRSVQDAMSLCCQKDHQHCHLEGAAPGYGSRTHYMEEYQPGLAATLAGALCIDEAPIHWETACAAEEEKQTTGSLIKLKADTRQEAIRVVQRLHRNLGHPGPEALAELLAARGASESVINAAKGYVCTACAKYKRPAQAAPAAMPKAKDFNALVQADVFWLRRGSTKFPILSLVDSATRYTAARMSNPSTTFVQLRRHGLHCLAHRSS